MWDVGRFSREVDLILKRAKPKQKFRLTKKGYITYLDSGDIRTDISKCNIMDVIPLGLGIYVFLGLN